VENRFELSWQLIVDNFSAIINHTLHSMKNFHVNPYYLSFSLTIFISAFLLFQIQPIIGKYILPWFGGTSFVWITSLLFFQTLLLAGYFYTFLLTKLSLKQQLIIHSILVLVIGLIIGLLFSEWQSPITPGVAVKLPDSVSPVLQVLAILSISVGLPYFLLSTTSTLLQRWFSFLPHQKSPYPLYALSNIGSLLAIITYPFLVEPFLPLQNQGQLWSVIFITLCILLLICGFQMFGSHVKTKIAPAKKTSSLYKTPRKQILLWLFLPAVSSHMLLAGTHQLTQGIAPIPFLWLLPLGLYLLSFIFCFSERSFYKRNMYTYAFIGTLPFILVLLLHSAILGIYFELTIYAIMLFSCFMICHGELFANRPPTEQLNKFYLLMSAGSVLGALIVAIIAPLFFIGLYWELLLGLLATTLIAVRIPTKDTKSLLHRLLSLVLTSQKEITYFSIAVVLGFYALFFTGMILAQYTEAIGIWRNFYGTLRVLQDNKNYSRCLLNGKIIHGCQSTTIKDQMKPTTYYGEKSLGLAIESVRNTDSNLRIGALGLGVGTIAAYGKTGDVIRFYELNPLDVEIAKKYFRYITKTPAKVETIIGDGRLSMEKELKENKPQNYNLLVVDAFNDDAIPVHLLTKEAFAVYKKHISEKGIIAVHMSNSYLDLIPVVAKAAAYHHMHVVFIDAPAANDMQTRSKWAFLANDLDLLNTPNLTKAKKAEVKKRDINLWTDNYSNLFQIVSYNF
jgi:hypothetical protein